MIEWRHKDDNDHPAKGRVTPAQVARRLGSLASLIKRIELRQAVKLPHAKIYSRRLGMKFRA